MATLYQIVVSTGKIIFPDGFTLEPPYESERYMEYADWVINQGNFPDHIEEETP